MAVRTEPAPCSRNDDVSTKWHVRSSGILRTRSAMKMRQLFIRPTTQGSLPAKTWPISRPSSSILLAICFSS